MNIYVRKQQCFDLYVLKQKSVSYCARSPYIFSWCSKI